MSIKTGRSLLVPMVTMVVTTALAIAACDEGRLVIELDLPSNSLLDPTARCRDDDCQDDPRLSRLSLRLSREGKQLLAQDALITSGAELSIGSVPVETPFDMRLAAQSSTGQILGLGVVNDVEVTPDDTTRVAVQMRKPIAYVVGGAALRVIDTAAVQDHELPPAKIPNLVDIAAASNGVLLAAVTTDALVRVRTSDHMAAGCKEAPPSCLDTTELGGDHGEPASCVAMSPDGDTALVCHETGLTAVTALGSNDPTLKFFQLGKTGKPSSVVFSRDNKTGWVLVNGGGRSCGVEKSVLVKLDLQALEPIGSPINIGQSATGLTLDPLDEAPLLALPCEGKIARIEGKEVTTVVEGLGSVYDMAVAQRSLVIVAALDEPDEPLRGQAFIIDRSDPSRAAFPESSQLASLRRTFEIPGLSVRLFNRQSPEGYLLWVSPPSEASIYDVEISPDGQRAMLLLQARYASDMRMSLNCFYRAELTGTSYLLVDLETDQVLLSRFTKLNFSDCYANCVNHEGTGMDNPQVCVSALTEVLNERGQLMSPAFDPASATLLFAGN